MCHVSTRLHVPDIYQTIARLFFSNGTSRNMSILGHHPLRSCCIPSRRIWSDINHLSRAVGLGSTAAQPRVDKSAGWNVRWSSANNARVDRVKRLDCLTNGDVSSARGEKSLSRPKEANYTLAEQIESRVLFIRAIFPLLARARVCVAPLIKARG